MSTETPRIDRIAFMARFKRDALGTFEAVHADSARQLERELTAAQSTIAEQAKEIERLTATIAAEGEVIDALRELQYRRAQAQPEPKHQTPENTAEPPAQSSAAPAPAAEPTITVSGPTACDKSFVMELIYKALRDAGLHPYSYELAHERRMVQEQPPPSAKVWHLREAVAAPQPAPAPAAEPVAWRYKEVINCGQGQFFEQEDFSYSATQPFAMGGRRLTWVEPLYAAPPQDETRELLREADSEIERLIEWLRELGKHTQSKSIDVQERIRAYLARHK